MNATQEKMLKDVHRAIVGEPDLGNKGVITRLSELEEKHHTTEKRVIVFGAIGAAALMGVKGAWDKLITLFI